METLTLQDQNKQTFWGKVLSKPTLEETKDGKFSFFIFETTRIYYSHNKREEEKTTIKCIAFEDKAEDLNMMLDKGDRGWIKGYFKNDKSDKSLTFVVGDYGVIAKV